MISQKGCTAAFATSGTAIQRYLQSSVKKEGSSKTIYIFNFIR